MKTSLDHLPEFKRAQLADVVAALRERADRYGKEKLELPPTPVREPPRSGQADSAARGKAEGLREGKAEGVRVAVLDLCEAFGVEVTDERRARLGAMGVDELEALRAALKQTRRWPA